MENIENELMGSCTWEDLSRAEVAFYEIYLDRIK